MADGASSAEDSPDDDSDFSRTCTTTRHRKRLDDDSDLGRTSTATGHKKRSLISQTAAHREERLAVERLQHIPFFITSSYYTCTLPYTSFSLLYVFYYSGQSPGLNSSWCRCNVLTNAMQSTNVVTCAAVETPPSSSLGNPGGSFQG